MRQWNALCSRVRGGRPERIGGVLFPAGPFLAWQVCFSASWTRSEAPAVDRSPQGNEPGRAPLPGRPQRPGEGLALLGPRLRTVDHLASKPQWTRGRKSGSQP